MKSMTTLAGAVLVVLGLAPGNAALAAYTNGALRLPAAALARDGEVPVTYQLDQGFTGQARFNLRWTDSLGRTIADRTASAMLRDETRFSFRIDLARAVALSNHLHVDLLLDGQDVDGKAYRQQQTADIDFIARPRQTGWRDYRVMMWQAYPAEHWPVLKKLGVTGGQTTGRNATLPHKLIETNTRWYSGRLAPKFYSAYHRWRPDRPVNWSFDQAKKQYQQNPDSRAAFKRHPSLEDPRWQKRVRRRAIKVARRDAPYHPYFYSLSDEAGIADLEAQWDFDLSAQSLAPMRRWLRRQYKSLGALNRAWGTAFQAWHNVVPMTTNEAMAQKNNNFAAWADFKTWMDISFANALKMGVDAIHQGDPGAYVAITGAQKPGWGGYDYARLTQALTAIEPYDIGRSVDIVASLAPDMPVVTTSFSGGRDEKHRVWRELLHGNRGLIVWDANHDFVKANGKPGKRGRRAGRYLNEIENGIGALIINSRAANHRIAIHYSQPSLRTQWLLERRPAGAKWMQRGAKFERTHNHFMRLRESWCNLIADLGLQADFVSYAQIPKGALLKRGYDVLVLPESSSMSQAEAGAIRSFVAAGGLVIASGMPATYNEHSRQLDHSQLADLFDAATNEQVSVRRFGQGKAILLNLAIAPYLERRLEGRAEPVRWRIGKLLRDSGVQPRFAIEDEKGHGVVGIERRVFKNGGVRLISLQTNPQRRVDELGPPTFQSNARFYQDKTIRLKLPRPLYVYDVRRGRALGRKRVLKRTVDAYEPTLLAVSDAPLARMRVSVPKQAERGRALRVAVHVRPSRARVTVFHVDVRDPDGKLVRYYSKNLISRQGGGGVSIPLALNDPHGRWTITVDDRLSGQSVTRRVAVE